MESKTKEEAGHKFTVTPFVGTTANKMLVRVQQNFQGGFISCDPDTWQTFCIEFLERTFVDGKEVGQEANFDSVFQGNFALLFQAIDFTAEVNFGKDFFTLIANSGATKAGQARKAGK